MGQIRDEILLKKIAMRLKELREKANLSQEELINETSIHIGRIETGKNNLTVSTLKKICVFFNIKLKDFFEDID
jgi:transcriptional regulator with XRE-family HTH domain